jgi:hypothetical protein
VVRDQTTVKVTFDFERLDNASASFLNGQRAEPPLLYPQSGATSCQEEFADELKMILKRHGMVALGK